MKRKGEDYATSPSASVVLASPLNQIKCTDTPSPFSVLSPFSQTPPRTWEETCDAADKILLQFDGPKATNDMITLKENKKIIDGFENDVDVLQTKSNRLKEEIQFRINDCLEKYNKKIDSIRLQRELIEELRNEIDSIKSITHESIEKERELKIKIDQYKDQASQEIEEIDEVEEEKKAEVSRLQEHVSLLAVVSGIKWDYECVESIAGEVEVPSKGKHVRFEIDPDEHSPYEITNLLWDLISS